MARHSCTACGNEFHASELLLDGHGFVCRACDADRALDRLLHGVVRSTIIASPLRALVGTVLFATVVLLGPVAPLAAMVCGLAAVFAGLNAVWVGGTLLREKAVGKLQLALLFTSGTFGGLWGAAVATGGLLASVLYASAAFAHAMP